MAHVLSFLQFAISFIIGGLPAEIWAPVCNLEARVVEAWVASETGKEYSVLLKRLRDIGCDLGGRLTIDGSQAQGTSRIVSRHSTGVTVYSGHQTSAVTEKPFTFSALQTTDDETFLFQQQSPSQPGTIVLELYRMVAISQAHPLTSSEPAPPQCNVIHERSKEVGCHMTSLGYERSSRPCSSIFAVPFTPSDFRPYATFIFRYRPAEVLRAAGIMPPLPTVPLSLFNRREEERAGDDEDEVDQAEAEIAALQTALRTRIEALAKRKRVKVEDIEEDILAKKPRLV